MITMTPLLCFIIPMPLMKDLLPISNRLHLLKHKSSMELVSIIIDMANVVSSSIHQILWNVFKLNQIQRTLKLSEYIQFSRCNRKIGFELESHCNPWKWMHFWFLSEVAFLEWVGSWGKTGSEEKFWCLYQMNFRCRVFNRWMTTIGQYDLFRFLSGIFVEVGELNWTPCTVIELCKLVDIYCSLYSLCSDESLERSRRESISWTW